MNITEMAAQLKLPYIRDNWQQWIEEARRTKPDYTAFLANLLDGEVQLRLSNGQTRRIREAKFPLKKHREHRTGAAHHR